MGRNSAAACLACHWLDIGLHFNPHQLDYRIEDARDLGL
jgi:hypothetical protein